LCHAAFAAVTDREWQLSLPVAAASRYTATPIDRGDAMRRLLIILPYLIVVAACTDAPPPAFGPQQGVRASFPPGSVINVIRINALDSQPLRTAELVAPDGTVTPASELNAVANPKTLGERGSLSDPWRNSVMGNAPDLQSSGGMDPTPRLQSQLLLTVSTADIALPDPVTYRRDWANYKIRLSFGSSGNDIREIAAPQPPAEPAGS
jgi:hypothetical protein